MRLAEWINVVFFAFFIVLAGLRQMRISRRLKATAIGLAGIVLTLVANSAGGLFAPRPARVIRDWLPFPVLLMAYWQVGQFFSDSWGPFQAKLEEFDRRWLAPWAEKWKQAKTAAWLAAYFEFAYMFCYAMVPAALGVLYLLGLDPYAAEFWAAVVPSAYLCYGLVAFLPTLPPRFVERRAIPELASGRLRRLNLWILRQASIQANTFPSAHVAASVAAALVLLRHAPGVGLVFLWVAFSIGVGAVLGRYHFVLDVLAGAGVAVLFFFWTAGAFP